ncbi:MAG: hypothetical protein WD801_11440 [Gemmatimonadaceae bacterium]
MRRPHRASHAALALSLALCGCLDGPGITGPGPIGEGRRILFVGNSYLYTQHIPSIVVALADSAGGDKLAALTVAAPDVALIDHWNSGVATGEIRRGGWDWVVLQQGPSSVEVNRDSLRLVTALFAAEMATVHARPALFSAWPQASRRQDFPRAIESYTLAAQDVDGVLLPVAAAWLAAWERDATINLYADGLHPSVEGAYLSALVIYARLLEKTPRGLPRALKLSHGPVISVSAARAALLQDAAAEVTGFP